MKAHEKLRQLVPLGKKINIEFLDDGKKRWKTAVCGIMNPETKEIVYIKRFKNNFSIRLREEWNLYYLKIRMAGYSSIKVIISDLNSNETLYLNKDNDDYHNLNP